MKRSIALAIGSTLLVVSCGGGTSPTTAVVGATTVPPASVTTAPPAASTATVSTGSTSLGEVVVDGAGMTLYVFGPDNQGDSTCYDECAANWPPMAGDATAGAGIDAALLGTSTRTDGTTQATYNGWPLYHFAQDSAPGDTLGQGQLDVWYVVDAAGEAVTATQGTRSGY